MNKYLITSDFEQQQQNKTLKPLLAAITTTTTTKHKTANRISFSNLIYRDWQLIVVMGRRGERKRERERKGRIGDRTGR